MQHVYSCQCMVAYKKGGCDGAAPGHTGCPLCRSTQATGLTPCRPQTGFVSGRAMHSAISQRASAARLAVQRSLAARATGAAVTTPGVGSPATVDISSPYQQVLRQEAANHRPRSGLEPEQLP
mmetsp:Transcript_13838/g.31323  ORF Transcript_13838/g.31323 Transcript_13838/m.31323 type:complete len:123 (-) Transcript_13838:230-598(-)